MITKGGERRICRKVITGVNLKGEKTKGHHFRKHGPRRKRRENLKKDKMYRMGTLEKTEKRENPRKGRKKKSSFKGRKRKGMAPVKKRGGGKVHERDIGGEIGEHRERTHTQQGRKGMNVLRSTVEKRSL